MEMQPEPSLGGQKQIGNASQRKSRISLDRRLIIMQLVQLGKKSCYLHGAEAKNEKAKGRAGNTAHISPLE